MDLLIMFVMEHNVVIFKVNVLIRGKHNNMIDLVQFLLNVMKDIKDKSHNLYAIQRKIKVQG